MSSQSLISEIHGEKKNKANISNTKSEKKEIIKDKKKTGITSFFQKKRDK